jgi:protein-disulfide isomerase
MKKLFAIALLLLAPVAAHAQILGESQPNNLQHLSELKPPAGSKVAIVVFEDLGCPACAYAHPIENEASKETGVPIIHRDFPIAAHVWTMQGAVCARYIHDKISPHLSDQYRNDVFSAQRGISSDSDIMQYTRAWLVRHGQNIPFVMDPGGLLEREVQSDYNLGLHINVQYTPTIVVVTKDKQQVICGTATSTGSDASNILPVVRAALASTTVHRSTN